MCNFISVRAKYYFSAKIYAVEYTIKIKYYVKYKIQVYLILGCVKKNIKVISNSHHGITVLYECLAPTGCFGSRCDPNIWWFGTHWLSCEWVGPKYGTAWHPTGRVVRRQGPNMGWPSLNIPDMWSDLYNMLIPTTKTFPNMGDHDC